MGTILKGILFLAKTCPTDYDKVTVDGKTHCYYWHPTMDQFDASQTICEGKSNGHLAVITSEAEMSALRTWLKTKGKYLPVYSLQTFAF